ncbi:MAG: SDR family NAD(P)-dependent oxidoreductase [Elusimicrobiota bacterium]|jgi:short-subunit dehydrogenase
MALRILITGATSGLGQELARQLAAQGCRLALTGRRAERLHEIAEEARRAGAQVLELAGDVTDRDCVERHYAEIKTHFGGLDWAVLNAGISKSKSARIKFSSDDYRQVFETNIFGAVYWIEQVLPDMLLAGSGVIAGVSSIAGYRGLPNAGAYSASKAAFTSLLESVRVDVRGTGVDVVTICPGFVRTELTDRWKPEDMPFLMEPRDAAKRMIAGIRARKRVVHFPWPLSSAMKYVVRNLPGWIYDRVVARAAKRRPKY